MKKHIQIKYGYRVWKPSKMIALMGDNSPLLIIEWWLHNIGYYITLPYRDIPSIKALNDRFKHVDLMVRSEDTE